MSKQIFNVGDGYIKFEGDKMIISDKARFYKRLHLFSSSLWVLYSVISFFLYFGTEEKYLFWLGLVIGVCHLIIFIVYLFRSTKSEILKNEILSVNIKERLGNYFLNIKLRNGQLRRVSKIDGITNELQLYLDTNFELDD